MSLRLPDSGAPTGPDGRRHAPSAARNAAPILGVLRRIVLPGDRVLELASGTGQHAAEFAPALGADWQPSDVVEAHFASIRAWTVGAARPPVRLDACAPGWARQGVLPGAFDVVLAVNLLHLVTMEGAAVLIGEAAHTLAPGGRLVVYGPFLRDGVATSAGDAAFDADLRAHDPQIGYKDLAWVQGRMQAANLRVEVARMPANNLMLIAFKA